MGFQCTLHSCPLLLFRHNFVELTNFIWHCICYTFLIWNDLFFFSISIFFFLVTITKCLNCVFKIITRDYTVLKKYFAHESKDTIKFNLGIYPIILSWRRRIFRVKLYIPSRINIMVINELRRQYYDQWRIDGWQVRSFTLHKQNQLKNVIMIFITQYYYYI